MKKGKQKKIARRIRQAKAVLRKYEASESSNYHRTVVGGGASADVVTAPAVRNLRSWARYLDENHDLCIGIFDNIVNRVCGAGLTYEPIIKDKSGKLLEKANDEVRDLWIEFWRRPDVTGELPGTELERLACRTWLRDGEVLTNHVMGAGPSVRHNSRIPYSVEMLEGDYLPMDLNSDMIRHGVGHNAWGRPVNYHLYKKHPGETFQNLMAMPGDIKTVSAEFITHTKFVRRFQQTRGVSLLHGIIHRLDDIKDYSESERIKARVNAAFTTAITRTADYVGEVDENGNRPFEMQSGIIFDGLRVGEKLESVGTDTPNPNLGPFIQEMMRAAASGTGTSYSSISKHYDSTYSAMRQESVEAKEGYLKLFTYFKDVQIMSIWENFITMIVSSGMFVVPAGVSIREMKLAVSIRGPGVDWIDPKKESDADVTNIDNGLKSRHQVIREHGGDPRQVDRELAADNFEPVQQVQQPALAKPETKDELDADDTESDNDEDTESEAA